jgi:hypothetical protein
MSRERTNILGIVVLTIFGTLGLLAAGWFAATKYMAQQTASAPPPEEPAAAPTPKRKVAPRPKTDTSGSTSQGATSTDAADPQNGTAAATASLGQAVLVPRELAPSEREGEPTAARKESPSVVATPVPEARADARGIMEESQRRNEAKSYEYDGLLQSYDSKDKVSEKRWTFDRIGSHGQSKAVLRFTAPAEVKGVALLIDNHPDRASDQWMWTPAIERDRRIAMQDRSTRFFGTDFSFEDLEEHDVDQYDYSMMGNETIDGADCWKIKMVPKSTRSSQYTQLIAWIRKDNYTWARVDHFVKDEIVRRLSNSSIENIQGIWTSKQMEMTDLRKKTRTRLTLQQVKYNLPVKDSDFTLQAIRR